MHPANVLISAMLLSLVLLKINQRYASPRISIVNRWIRWGVVAGSLALLSEEFAWSPRPFWGLFTAYLIGWLLLDGIFRWVGVHSLSVSTLPLFPRFTENRAGDEWPAQKPFPALRDQLRTANFKQIQSLRAGITEVIYVRLSIYQSEDNTTRLQVALLPQATGGVLACIQFCTRTASDRLIVTDNHHLPFGGFYPENWSLERRPRTRSFRRLFALHRDRLAAACEAPVPWTTEPLNDINAQQSELERLNTELGFLLPSPLHEEHGRISHEGRYRVWKEMLTLDYFGRSARYE